jgi:Domain of unknown function (DUF1918)
MVPSLRIPIVHPLQATPPTSRPCAACWDWRPGRGAAGGTPALRAGHERRFTLAHDFGVRLGGLASIVRSSAPAAGTSRGNARTPNYTHVSVCCRHSKTPRKTHALCSSISSRPPCRGAGSGVRRSGERRRVSAGVALVANHWWGYAELRDEEGEMAFEVGERVVAESESTDRRPRPGVIQGVLRSDRSPRYRIRWDDGHESIYTPGSGALRAERRQTGQAKARPRKPKPT